jgi:thioredoxin reductase (NADPH)
MNGPGEAAVVGGGPCGVAAAIQLKRSGIPSLLFERKAVGGLLWNAHRVENYPGYPRGVPGPALCGLMERHLREAGVEVVFDEVAAIRPGRAGYTLQTAKGRTAHAGAVVIATGTLPRAGFLEGEDRLAGRRIFYEVREIPICPPGRRTAILGGSDAAYDYALNLASKGGRVVILQRSPARCLPLLAHRVRRLAGVEVLESVRVDACLETANGLEIRLAGREGRNGLEVDFLLIACGRSPDQGLVAPLQTPHPGSGSEGIFQENLPPGIFLGGDLVRGDFRQAGIAVGDGLVAAMAAARYLGSRQGKERTGPVGGVRYRGEPT